MAQQIIRFISPRILIVLDYNLHVKKPRKMVLFKGTYLLHVLYIVLNESGTAMHRTKVTETKLNVQQPSLCHIISPTCSELIRDENRRFQPKAS